MTDRVVVGQGDLELAKDRERLLAERAPEAWILGHGLDPVGFVVQHQDTIMRFVDPRLAASLRSLLQAPAVQAAIDDGLLSPMTAGGDLELPGYATFTHGRVLRPIPRDRVPLQAAGDRLLELDARLRTIGYCIADAGLHQWLAGDAGPRWADWGSVLPSSFVPRSRVRFLVHWLYFEPAAGPDPQQMALARSCQVPYPRGHGFHGIDVRARARALVGGMLGRLPAGVRRMVRRAVYHRGAYALPLSAQDPAIVDPSTEGRPR